MAKGMHRIAGLVLALLLAWSMVAPALAQTRTQTVDVPIRQGHVPESLRVLKLKVGDLVRLRFTADKAMSLHLHGYDIETDIKPGAAAEMAFEAYAAGRFDVTVHGKGGGHGHGALLRLEVYPR